MDMDHFSKNVAFYAALACVFVSLKCSWAFATRRPRLFTVFALIAVGWAQLVAYYATDHFDNELLPGFSAFLLIYAAGLLHREGEDRRYALNGMPPPAFHEVPKRDRVALYLLGCLLAPPLVRVIQGIGFTGSEVPRKALEGLIVFVLILTSFWYTYRALFQRDTGLVYCLGDEEALPPSYQKWFARLLIVYAVLEVAYLPFYFAWIPTSTPGTSPMPWALRLAFALCKLLFVLFLLWIVLWSQVPSKERTPDMRWLMVDRFIPIGQAPIPGWHTPFPDHNEHEPWPVVRTG